MPPTPLDLVGRDAVDVAGRHLAMHYNATDVMTWRRAVLIPLVLLISLTIILQEGYGVAQELIDGAQFGRLDLLPAVLLPLLALASIGGLLLIAPRVHRRSLARLTDLGLNDT